MIYDVNEKSHDIRQIMTFRHTVIIHWQNRYAMLD